MAFEKKDRIIKVVFYEIEIDGEIYQEAAVFRESGMTIESKEEGIDALLKLAKLRNIKKMEDLKKSKYYEVLKEDKLKEKYPGIYDMIMEDVGFYDVEDKEHQVDESKTEEEQNIEKKDESDNKNTEAFDDDDDEYDAAFDEYRLFENVLNKFKTKKFAVKAGLFAVIGLVAVGGFNLVKKAINFVTGSSTKKIENQNSDIKVPVIKNEDINLDNLDANTIPTYDCVDDVLQKAEISTVKSKTLTKIWNYLSYYNDTVASKYISNTTTTKLAHTWDEAVVFYLAYNNVSRDDANKIFDYYNISVDEFKKAYNAGIKQDVIAYKAITSSTHKEELIDSETGKEFYKKYEDMIIEFNKSEDDYKTKQRLVDKFYREVRIDYQLGSESVTLNDYQLSVIPIIKAFNQLTEDIESEYGLSAQELKYINNLGEFSHIEEKINTLSTSVYSYNLAQQALESETDEYLYADIKALAIDELTKKDAYFISEANRNIANHADYVEKVEIKEEEKEETVKTEEENKKAEKTEETKKEVKPTTTPKPAASTVAPTSTPKPSSSTKSTNNSDLYIGIIEDDDKEDKIPDWMLEENDQEQEEVKKATINKSTEVEKEKTKEETKEEIVIDEVYEVEPDTPTQSETVNVSEEISALNGTVEYMEEYTDSNGNLDNSVIDVTNDVADVSTTEELPDPNNNDIISDTNTDYEAVAEKIVEDMANNPTQVEETSYQYTR